MAPMLRMDFADMEEPFLLYRGQTGLLVIRAKELSGSMTA